ncbi:MAG: hypothetical protein LUE14_13020 [Clostridiales bacterium]|nr:hypothetical protein [Clostridiales bacterium]
MTHSVYTYEDYLENPETFTLEEMREIHTEIMKEIYADQDAAELYEQLLRKAVKYAGMRAGWLLMSREEKLSADASRTACHDSVITHFNMLARYLKSQGKSTLWRKRLGYTEDDPYRRKSIGDFACYLVFVNSLNAR